MFGSPYMSCAEQGPIRAVSRGWRCACGPPAEPTPLQIPCLTSAMEGKLRGSQYEFGEDGGHVLRQWLVEKHFLDVNARALHQ